MLFSVGKRPYWEALPFWVLTVRPVSLFLPGCLELNAQSCLSGLCSFYISLLVSSVSIFIFIGSLSVSLISDPLLLMQRRPQLTPGLIQSQLQRVLGLRAVRVFFPALQSYSSTILIFKRHPSPLPFPATPRQPPVVFPILHVRLSFSSSQYLLPDHAPHILTQDFLLGLSLSRSAFQW